MRAIDADKLDQFLENAEIEARHKRKYVLEGAINILRGNIRTFPIIEPERKTGKWIYGENKYGHDGWQCDQCGHWILWDYHVSMEDAERDLPKYCPNCGARLI